MFDRQQQKRLWEARIIDLMLADEGGAYKFLRGSEFPIALIAIPPLEKKLQSKLNLP